MRGTYDIGNPASDVAWTLFLIALVISSPEAYGIQRLSIALPIFKCQLIYISLE